MRRHRRPPAHLALMGPREPGGGVEGEKGSTKACHLAHERVPGCVCAILPPPPGRRGLLHGKCQSRKPRPCRRGSEGTPKSSGFGKCAKGSSGHQGGLANTHPALPHRDPPRSPSASGAGNGTHQAAFYPLPSPKTGPGSSAWKNRRFRRCRRLAAAAAGSGPRRAAEVGLARLNSRARTGAVLCKPARPASQQPGWLPSACRGGRLRAAASLRSFLKNASFQLSPPSPDPSAQSVK